MSANPIVLSQRMVTETCCWKDCGITFAMTQDLYDQLGKTRANFYCPRGHEQHYTAQTDEEKLQAEVQRLQLQLQTEKDNKERIRAERDQAKRRLARQKKRAARGRCPVAGCKTRFDSLKEHLKSHKHWRRRYPAVGR